MLLLPTLCCDTAQAKVDVGDVLVKVLDAVKQTHPSLSLDLLENGDTTLSHVLHDGLIRVHAVVTLHSIHAVHQVCT